MDKKAWTKLGDGPKLTVDHQPKKYFAKGIHHRIHVNGVFTYPWMVDLSGKLGCKYASPMDSMGKGSTSVFRVVAGCLRRRKVTLCWRIFWHSCDLLRLIILFNPFSRISGMPGTCGRLLRVRLRWLWGEFASWILVLRGESIWRGHRFCRFAAIGSTWLNHFCWFWMSHILSLLILLQRNFSSYCSEARIVACDPFGW